MTSHLALFPRSGLSRRLGFIIPQPVHTSHETSFLFSCGRCPFGRVYMCLGEQVGKVQLNPGDEV